MLRAIQLLTLSLESVGKKREKKNQLMRLILQSRNS